MVFKKGNKINVGRSPWNKGKKLPSLSEEHKRKISASAPRGNLNPSRRPEVRKKISESKKGKLNWNYIDGRSKKSQGRKYKGKKHYSHFVWCNEDENHPYVPEGFAIHHLDLNPQNDNLSNLQIIQRGDHTKLHAQINRLRKEEIKI